MNDEQRDIETAEHFIGVWGSGGDVYAVPGLGWVYHGAPEWHASRYIAEDKHLLSLVSAHRIWSSQERAEILPAVPFFRHTTTYTAGEVTCLACEGTGDGEDNDGEWCRCPLCEGDGLLYWGEEAGVHVYEPAAPPVDALAAALAAACAPDADADNETQLWVRWEVDGTWRVEAYAAPFDRTAPAPESEALNATCFVHPTHDFADIARDVIADLLFQVPQHTDLVSLVERLKAAQ